MKVTIELHVEVTPGTSMEVLQERVTQQIERIANPDRSDEGITRVHSCGCRTDHPTNPLSGYEYHSVIHDCRMKLG